MGLTSQLYRDANPPSAQQNKGKLSEGIPGAVLAWRMLQGVKYGR